MYIDAEASDMHSFKRFSLGNCTPGSKILIIHLYGIRCLGVLL